MTDHETAIETVNLLALSEELLQTARTVRTRRSARSVLGGDGLLRQTVIALAAGAELAEHDSPPEATLQIVTGQVTVHGKGRSWELSFGDLVPIPPERHSVSARTDAVLLLTVRRDDDRPTGS